MKLNSPIRPILALVALSLAGTASAVLVDFNTTGELAGNFSLNGVAAYSEEAGTGLNSTRAVNVASTTGTAILTTANYSLALGTVNVSMYARAVASANVGFDSVFLQLGLFADNNQQFNGGSGDANQFVFARVLNENNTTAGNDTTYFLQTGSKATTAAAQSTTNGGNFTLTSGNWYYFSINFTRSSSDTVTVASDLRNSDSAGVVGTSVTTLSTNYTNAQIFGDTTIWAGFRGRLDGNTDTLDNFSAVPEPSTAMALLGGFGALAWVRRRNR